MQAPLSSASNFFANYILTQMLLLKNSVRENYAPLIFAGAGEATAAPPHISPRLVYNTAGDDGL